MWILYFASLGVCFFYALGETGDEAGSAFLAGLIPFLNIIFAVICAVFIVKRTHQSGFSCFWGHKFKVKYDSEAEKWKNGRRPLRISMGGSTSYECSECGEERYEKWSAF